MKKLSPTSRRLIISVACLQLVFLVVGLPVILFVYRFASPLAYILGLVAGGAFSIAKVWMMERGFEKTMNLPADKADNYGKLQYLLRYLFTIAFLVAVFLLRRWVDPIGSILGIFALQLASYITNFWEGRLEKGKEKTYRPYEEVVSEEEAEKEEPLL